MEQGEPPKFTMRVVNNNFQTALPRPVEEVVKIAGTLLESSTGATSQGSGWRVNCQRELRRQGIRVKSRLYNSSGSRTVNRNREEQGAMVLMKSQRTKMKL